MSFYSFEQIIPLVISSLFAVASVDIDDVGIGRSWPSANALKNILCDSAADVIIRIRELIAKNNAPVFIQCDKGHRKGVDQFVKLIVFWGSEKHKVRVFSLILMEAKGHLRVQQKLFFIQ